MATIQVPSRINGDATPGWKESSYGLGVCGIHGAGNESLSGVRTSARLIDPVRKQESILLAICCKKATFKKRGSKE